MENALPRKYRPTSLDQVIGQEHVVNGLRGMLADVSRIPHAILLTGPSGVGKTTLARIIANALDSRLTQVDATSCSVDGLRSLITHMRSPPFFDATKRKTVILEEAHGLSKSAWQTLLLPLEEPPSWAYWTLTTTDETKVPRTVQTRCHVYRLQPVASRLLVQHLADVAKREHLDVEMSVLEQCARAADGSVRQSLVLLQTVFECKDQQTVKELLRRPRLATEKQSRRDGSDTVDVVRLVRAGQTRAQMMDALGMSRTTLWRKLAKAIDSGAITEHQIKR